MRLLAGLICAVVAAFSQEPKEARISLQGKEILYVYAEEGPAGPKPAPLIVFLHPDISAGIDAAKALWKQWQPAVSERGWRLIAPWAGSAGPAWTDGGARAVEAVVRDAQQRFRVDAERIYIAGQIDGGSQVFYLISRIPDLWAAALAIQGTPKPAIDTNRVFGANTALVPVLWVLPPEEQPAMEAWRAKLGSQGVPVQIQPGVQVTVKAALDWLAEHAREPFPAKVDCETGNAAFARCYWLEMTKFDPALRNDVLRSTRVQPGSGASLDLGGFGFQPSAPGPGVLIGWLPDNYKGPLKLEDRIVSAGGRDLRDGEDYVRFLDAATEEKTIGVVVLRGGKRQRLETRIRLARREENVTVRVQAEYFPELSELQVVSRGVAGVKLHLPAHWLPCRIHWNGTEAGTAEKAACWTVDMGSKAAPCGP